jgi:hypothetical protein
MRFIMSGLLMRLTDPMTGRAVASLLLGQSTAPISEPFTFTEAP